MKISHYLRLGVVCSVIGVQTLISGCSQVVKGGAHIALSFSESYIVPPILQLNDAPMACASGESLTPLILATQGMGADPAKLAVFMYVSAGLCAEDRALENELRYLRASRANMIEEAQDARINQKRWAALAARRQQEAYNRFVERFEKEFRFKIGASCPTLKEDFDKLVYLVGLASGMQAIVNDIAAQGVVGVPKDIAAIVERGMACLDNAEYWGVPMATRAAVWSLLPGASEGKPDPFTVMKDSTRVGERKGVRLAHAIYALAAQAKGDEALLRDALKTYGAANNMAVNPQYRLLDALGGMMVQTISDRYWTEKTG
ncbi:MAG TPA: hypothetical protein PLF28_09695, partial [Agitococcus sp.]|nr:hypothetical protein [Agitococcus sp.]